jgi:hypothetical protein
LEGAQEIAADIVEPLEDIPSLLDEAFEEVIEQPIQQIGGEIVETIFGDQTPEVTPEITPEVVPDDPNAGLARGRRTPTRSKKPGAAGTLLEGGGVLYE